MIELLEQLAAAKPLVLVLDDLHWADPASVDLLVALLHRPPAAGVLIAVAARPRQLPPRLAGALDRAHRDGALTRLALGAVTREEARELIGPRADAVYDETGGNPFYLEQLARAGAEGSAPMAGVDVPPMVSAALGEELALLETPVRRVLDGASVAGDPFEIDLAAAAADVAEAQALDAVDELGRLDLVRPTDMPRRFRFRHPIVRRAVYDATPAGWRIGAHERAAAALAARGASATARAHHVERSGRHGDAAAVAVLVEAAHDSALRAPATAAHWFAAALRLLPDTATPQQRAELLLPQAQALTATGRFAESHATLLESLAIVPPEAPALRTLLSSTCARVEHLLGRHEQAHTRLVEALEELPDEVSPEGVSLMIELTMDGLHRMNYEAMRGWGKRAAAAAGQLDDDALRAAALAASARGAAVPGASAEAAALCAEAAALIDGMADDELARRLDAVTHLAGAELYLHRFADAHAHAERALAVGRATGQGQQFPLVFPILGITWFFEGEPGRGRRAARRRRRGGAAERQRPDARLEPVCPLADRDGAGGRAAGADRRPGGRRPDRRRPAQPPSQPRRVGARRGGARDRQAAAHGGAARTLGRRRGDAARRRELPRLLPRAARARPPRARPSRGGRACRRGGARERR